MHRAVADRAVDEAGRVAELVGDLDREAAEEELLRDGGFLRRLEPRQREDAPAPADVGEAEDVGEGGDEEVGLDEEEVHPAGLGLGDGLEDGEGVVLGPAAVVGGGEGRAKGERLARDERGRETAEGAPHVPRRNVTGVEEPDLHGRSIPYFRILL